MFIGFCLHFLVVYNLHAFFLLIQGHNGQKKYQVNLRSHSAPIQVMLINRETSCSKPVVVPVPPVDDISAMPTPPSTPAGLQRFPISSAELCDLKRGPLKSHAAEHQLTPSSTSPDMHMGTAFIHTDPVPYGVIDICTTSHYSLCMLK